MVASAPDLPQGQYQSLCDICNRFQNSIHEDVSLLSGHKESDLSTTKLRHESFSTFKDERGRFFGYRGPTIEHLTRNQTSCRLCEYIYEALAMDGLIANNNTSYSVLDLVWAMDSRVRDKHPLEVPRYTHFKVGVEIWNQQRRFLPIFSAYVIKIYAPIGSTPALRDACLQEVPSSDASLVAAEEWLKFCSHHHSNCTRTISGVEMKESYDNFTRPWRDADGNVSIPSYELPVNFGRDPLLPKRVIWIPEEGAPKLVEPAGKSGQYAALSYCWGVEETLTTTRANVASFKQELPIDQMPKTILDAITVCQKLGLRYLWVDAFCIVQDDRADWSREASKMADTYQYAALTIAALGGTSSTSGLLSSRETKFDSFRIPWFKDFGLNAEVLLRRPTDTVGHLSRESEVSKWATRGWVCQERILSRRVLYFGHHQLFWECQECTLSEDRSCYDSSEKRKIFEQIEAQDSIAESVIDDPAGTSSIFTMFVKEAESFIKKQLKFDMIRFGGFDWDILLRNYTARDLSMPGDKLIAFESLAQVIAARTDQEYCAGIWSKSFAKSLFWCAATKDLTRPPISRAPSWSWAAWDGEIRGYTSDRTLDLREAFSEGYGGCVKSPKFRTKSDSAGSDQTSVNTSFRATVQLLPGSRSETSCTQRMRLYSELFLNLNICPDEYMRWHPARTHLIFASTTEIPSRHPRGRAARQHRPNRYKERLASCQECPECHANFDHFTEAVILEHVESCYDGKTKRLADCDNSLDKLFGVACFDEPENPPKSFEMVLLWRSRLETPPVKDAFSITNGLRPSIAAGDIPMHEDSQAAVFSSLRDQGRYAATQEEFRARHHRDLRRFRNMRSMLPSDDDNIGRDKQRYFLLLVEPIEKSDTYRRVGIGIGYSHPLFKHFAGIPFHKAAPERRITVV